MDRNRFDLEVRPHLTEVPIGDRGIGFDREEIDLWINEYIAMRGRPGRVRRAQSADAQTRTSTTSDPSRVGDRQTAKDSGPRRLTNFEKVMAVSAPGYQGVSSFVDPSIEELGASRRLKPARQVSVSPRLPKLGKALLGSPASTEPPSESR